MVFRNKYREYISYQECFQSQDVENTFYKFESFMTDR